MSSLLLLAAAALLPALYVLARRRGLVALALALGVVGVGGTVAAASIDGSPDNQRLPAVTGDLKVDGVLQADDGQWSGSPTSIAYQWYRCTSAGVDCVALGGETRSTYRIDAADMGKSVRVRVTASNAEGATSARSNATAAIGRNSFTYVPCMSPDTGMGVWTGGGLPPGFSLVQDNPPFTFLNAIRCEVGRTVAGGIAGSITAGETTTPWTKSRIRYAVPSNLALLGGDLYRSSSFSYPLGTSLTYGPNGDVTGSLFGTCWHNFGCTAEGREHDRLAPGNRVAIPTDTPSGFSYSLHCHTNGFVCNGRGWHMIYGGRLKMRDDSTPTLVEDAAGTLVSQSTLTGSETLHLNARDLGAGLYRVRVVVDGAEVAAKVVNPTATCADVNPTNSDVYEFNSHTPCADSFDGALSFDTRSWPRGEHHVRVLLEDAGRNAVTLSSRTATIGEPVGDAPANQTVPAIGGQTRIGEALTVNNGTWTGEPTYSYAWQRCSSTGTNCSTLSGETSTKHRVESADVGSTLRVRVTARNAAGSAATVTPVTGVIARNTFTYVACANPATKKGVWSGGGLPPGFSRVQDSPPLTFGNYDRCSVGHTAPEMGTHITGGETTTPWTKNRLRYVVPANLALVGGELWRASSFSYPLATSLTYGPNGDVTGSLFGTCWHNFSCTTEGTVSDLFAAQNRVPVPSDSPSGISYSLHCHTNGGLCNGRGWHAIFGARLTVRDDSTPTLVENATGTLLGDATVAGKQTLHLNARDQGSGLYRVRVLLDGEDAAAKVISPSSTCADVNPANTDVHEFNSHTPCAGSFDGTLTFDAATWPRGEREMEVLLEDAGRNTVRLAKRNVTVGETAVGDPPANSALPVVGGQAKVGETMSVSNGTWSGSPTSFDHQWIRCAANGTNCANLAGETSSKHRVDGADIGSTFKVRVTARNGAGSTTVTSALTTAIARNTFTYVACANPDTGKGVGPESGFPAGFGRATGGSGITSSQGARCSHASAPEFWQDISANTYQPQSHSRLTYTTATDLTMMGGVLYRAAAFSGPLGTSLVKTPAATDLFANTFGTCWHNFGCTSEGPALGTASVNQVALPTDAPNGFAYSLHCHTNGGLCSGSGWATIRGARITLRDNTVPTLAKPVAGDLVTRDKLGGTYGVDLDARDTGSGLYRVRALIDGEEVAAKIVNEATSCKDVNPDNSDKYEFNSHTPCGGSFTGTIKFDTSSWPAGEHELQLVLEDAGRNSVTLNKRKVTITEPDTTAPEVTSVTGRMAPNADPIGDDAQLNVKATDAAGSGVVRTRVLVGGQLLKADDEIKQACPDGGCSFSDSFVLNTASVTEGNRTVRVEAIDAAGNVGSKEWTIEVDHTAPEITRTGRLGSSDGWIGRRDADNVTVTGEDTRANGAEEPTMVGLRANGSELEGVAASSCSSTRCARTYRVGLTDASRVPEGTQNFVATATDRAGNVSTTSFSAKIDREPPALATSGSLVSAVTAGTALDQQTSYSVTAAATDGTQLAPRSGVYRVQLLVDDTPVAGVQTECAFDSCSRDAEWQFRPADYPNARRVGVRAVDRAGNVRIRQWAVGRGSTARCADRAADGDALTSGTATVTEAYTAAQEAYEPAVDEPASVAVRGGGGTRAAELETDTPLGAADNGFSVSDRGVGATVSEQAEDGYSLETPQGRLCISPRDVSSSAGDAVLVDDDAAVVYTNVAKESDLIVRPKEKGVETFTTIRGAGAPEEFAFDVQLEGDEELVAAPNGGVVVVDPTPAEQDLAAATPAPSAPLGSAQSDAWRAADPWVGQVPEATDVPETSLDGLAAEVERADDADVRDAELDELIDADRPALADLPSQGSAAPDAETTQKEAEISAAISGAEADVEDAIRDQQVAEAEEVEAGDAHVRAFNEANGGDTRAVVAAFRPTWGKDANGDPVETDLVIDGDVVKLKVDHRDESVAYPIVVDPWIEVTKTRYVDDVRPIFERRRVKVGTELKVYDIGYAHPHNCFRPGWACAQWPNGWWSVVRPERPAGYWTRFENGFNNWSKAYWFFDVPVYEWKEVHVGWEPYKRAENYLATEYVYDKADHAPHHHSLTLGEIDLIPPGNDSDNGPTVDPVAGAAYAGRGCRRTHDKHILGPGGIGGSIWMDTQFCWNKGKRKAIWDSNSGLMRVNGNLSDGFEIAGYKLKIRNGDRAHVRVPWNGASKGAVEMTVPYETEHCMPAASIVLGCTSTAMTYYTWGHYDGSAAAETRENDE